MQEMPVSTRLDKQVFGHLQLMAKEEERTVSFLIRKAVEQFVQQNRKVAKVGMKNRTLRGLQ